MLAKFGLTSPFNKRKVKEPNNKEMLPQQQHLTTGIPSSGIPSIKKASNIPSSSGLPVFNSLNQNNNESLRTPQKKASGLPRTNNQSHVAQFSSSESKSSGLNYGSNIKRISVNSSTKTSRSTSPAESNFSSSTNLNSTSNSTTNIAVMSKQTGSKLTKLPQASTLKKKPTLPVKTPTTTPVRQPANSAIKSSVSGTIKTNLKPAQSPSSNNVSKLQAPGSIQLNYASKTNKDDAKVAKKLGSLITPSNIVNLKSLKKSPEKSASNATVPSKIAAVAKEPTKSAPIQPTKKSTPSFGIAKVTKPQSASSVPQPQVKKDMIPQSKLTAPTSSQIPNITGISKPTNQSLTTPKKISKPLNGLMFSPKKLSVTVNSQTLTKKSFITKEAPVESKETNIVNIEPSETLRNKVELIEMEKENCYAEIIMNDYEDDHELDLNDENIKPINDDNEEFQKFMSADNIDNNNNNNKRVDQQDDVINNKLTKSVMSQLSPPLPPPPMQQPQLKQQQRNDMSLSSLPSPPPLPTHSLNLQISPNKKTMTSSLLVNTNSNLNTFGRSNTLDRKPKHIVADFNEKVTNYQNFSNSLERKHIVDSDSNYRLFNTVKTQQIIQNGSPQRNSLNLTLKPPSPNTSQRLKTPNGTYSKRPLSQDTIMENSSFLLSYPNQQQQKSTPSSPEHYMLMQSQSNLKIELDNAKNQVFILTNQLNTNSQVVSTLEQSLSVLTYKLQKSSLNIQKKDNTIAELRSYIEQVHKKYAKLFEGDKQHPCPPNLSTLNRHNSNESLNSLNSMISHRTSHYANASSFLSSSFANENTSLNESIKSNDPEKSPSKKKGWLRSSFRKAFNRKPTDTTSSGDKQLTSPSINSTDSGLENNLPKKCLSDVDENDFANRSRFIEFDDNVYIQNNIDLSLPNSPMHQVQLIKNSKLSPQMPLIDEEMSQYQRDLRDKESKLTDLRLEALATAHQLDSQKEENLKMKIEIEALKIENLKMQTFFNSQFNQTQVNYQKVQTHQSVCSSLSSPSPSSSTSSSSNSKLNLSLSTNHVDSNSFASSILTPHSVKLKSPSHGFGDNLKSSEININDGKRVAMTIYLGDSDPLKEDPFKNQICIGMINISTRTNWETLDTIIRNGFKDYINKLDTQDIPSLGLNLSSIKSYYVGEMPRIDHAKTPDLLPYGYLVGDHTNIIIQLKRVTPEALNDIDMLCYDTLVAKQRMQCYISLLLDHKYLLFCGPNGTCKSYIAKKLGEFVANRLGKDVDTSIAYYNVENKSSKDLKQFLSNITEQESVLGADVPHVLILDNLQNIGNNSDVFHEFFNGKSNTSYVIGTINQSDVSSLNLHSNFKWVLCANHTEPVKSYLKRFLIRRRIDYETKNHSQNPDLEKIVEWIPQLWEHINKYIELYNSNDLSLGPKIFTGIPFDFKQSLSWFIELWNNHLVPFMIETVKEGVQVYGTKMSWEDPKQWIASTFPWSSYDSSVITSLYSIEPQHVGFDTDTESSGELSSSNDDEPKKEKDFEDLDNLNNLNILERDTGEHNFVNNDNDKLLSMLIRLQECTNPSRPVSTLSGFTNCGFNNYDVNNILVNESNL